MLLYIVSLPVQYNYFLIFSSDRENKRSKSLVGDRSRDRVIVWSGRRRNSIIDVKFPWTPQDRSHSGDNTQLEKYFSKLYDLSSQVIFKDIIILLEMFFFENVIISEQLWNVY